MRVGSIPHELAGEVLGQEPSSGESQPESAGLVQHIMLPEVSTASMKYGRAAGGQCAGLVDRHALGSVCASASGAASSAIADALPTKIAAPRVDIQLAARRELRPSVQSPPAFNQSFITKPP
jgi:hypothetical protein